MKNRVERKRAIEMQACIKEKRAALKEVTRLKELLAEVMNVRSADTLTSKAVAKTIGITEPTLSQWRKKGAGPEYTREGRFYFYDKKAFLDWMVGR